MVRWRALAVAVGAGMMAAAPAVTWGALSASAADLALGQLTYSHTDQVSTGTLTLTAADTGTAGLGLLNAGWNVSLVASDFVSADSGNPASIGSDNLVITTAAAPTRVSGQAISPAGGPRTTGVTGSLDVERSVMQADGPTGVLIKTYYGIGTYRQAVDVSLLIPGQTAAGTYTATMTVTISAGP